MIAETITKLREILESSLTYANASGYEDANIEELVQLNKYPFFNITCEGWETTQPNNMSIRAVERNVINILIQCATRALTLQVAKQGDSGRIGIYEMLEDIWTAIRTNPNLDKTVDGYLPGSSVIIDVVEAEGNNERYFIGAAEMRIKLYKDIGR